MVAVEDKGLPIDFSRPPQASALGLTLMRGFAEEIRFLNLGKGGRRIEFAASLPARPIDDYLTAAERDRSAEEPPLAADKPRLRLMIEDDAVALARCIYRAYGYTYVDFIYYPDRIAEMLRAGLMMSCVAENDAGEIVGHLALLRNAADSAIAESAIAVVDPRYRGHSLFKTMKVFMAEEAARRGLLGLYSEAMTLHPFTQKGNIALGAHETGLVLAYVPPGVDTRKIAASPQGERAALLLYYMRTNAEPHRTVFRAAASPRGFGGHCPPHQPRPHVRRSAHPRARCRGDAARRQGAARPRRRHHHGSRVRRGCRPAGSPPFGRPLPPQARCDLSRPAAR